MATSPKLANEMQANVDRCACTHDHAQGDQYCENLDRRKSALLVHDHTPNLVFRFGESSSRSLAPRMKAVASNDSALQAMIPAQT
jgi:hypothetical protein